jgi:hypothetical protein
MEFGISVSNAYILYAASTVLIGLSLAVLNYAWKALEKMLPTLPVGEKRIRFNLKSIKDERAKFKATIIFYHFLGCIVLAFSVATCTLTILAVSSTMLGFNFGGYQQENYQAGRTLLSVGILSFAIGLWLITPRYISRIVSTIRGKPDILTADIATLPPLPARRSKAIDTSVVTFLIVFVTLSILGIFEIWFSGLIAVVVSVIAYFITKCVEKRQMPKHN